MVGPVQLADQLVCHSTGVQGYPAHPRIPDGRDLDGQLGIVQGKLAQPHPGKEIAAQRSYLCFQDRPFTRGQSRTFTVEPGLDLLEKGGNLAKSELAVQQPGPSQKQVCATGG